MDLKQIVDLIMIILGVVITLVPYVAALLIRTKNRFLQGVGKEAIKITSALEETSLSGEAKKAAAVSKLDQMLSLIKFDNGFLRFSQNQLHYY